MKNSESFWGNASLRPILGRNQLTATLPAGICASNYFAGQPLCRVGEVARNQWPGTRASAEMRLNASLRHGPKRWRYSPEMMKAFTISALIKLPLNWLSLPNQKL